MKKKVPMIVLTGGPCGGKTTSIEYLKEMLKNEGYTVITLSETATDVMNSGIKVQGEPDETVEPEVMQETILDLQVVKEDSFQRAAQKIKNNKVVILLDRGILDNRAYISYEKFDKMCVPRCLEISEIMEKYEAVIHLRSVAVDKPRAYTKATNAVRMENIKDARDRDRRTMESWKAHKHFVEIGNDCEFDEKMDRVKDEVRKVLGLPIIKARRKFLVSELDFDEILEKGYELSSMLIEYFVGYEDEEKIDIYTKVESIDNDITYSHTRITPAETTKRPISKEEYSINKERIDKDPILIHRYLVKEAKKTHRLDLYHNGLEMVTIEVANQVDPPSFVKGCQDITEDERFKMENLYSHKEKVRPMIKEKIS